MATTLSPVNVIALGSQIAGKGKSSCTKNTSFFTKNPLKTTTGRSVFSNPNLVGAPFHTLRAFSGPNPTGPSPQDDSQYVLKLGVGSVLGAALIKYGSILIPDITRPNLTQALLMISAPVVIAVLLLLKESSKE